MKDQTNEQYMQQKILSLRKSKQMTQEDLANLLGVSYQAVSKWENGQACPDIMTLPKLAGVFNISIDALFYETEDRTIKQPEDLTFDWKDDDTYYVVMAKGHTLLEVTDHHPDVAIHIDDPLASLVCHLNLTCQNVTGPVTVSGNMSCRNVKKQVTTGGSLTCKSVKGEILIGGNLSCDYVQGDVNAGGTVNCDNVEGDVSAGASVTCHDVNGNVKAGVSVKCKSVDGKMSN